LQTQSNYIKKPFLPLLLSSLLFLLSGLLSAYCYCRFYDFGGIFMPGIIYTSSTILLFVSFQIPVRGKEWLMYFLKMNLIYLIVWVLTMISSWFVIIFGVLTAGGGATSTFILTDKAITKFPFSRTAVFIAGGMSFVLVDIISLDYDFSLSDYLFNRNWSSSIFLADIFIFWQLITGIMLAIHLRKSQISQNEAMDPDSVEP